MGRPVILADDNDPLPGILGEIEEALDRETALALQRLFPGQRIYLPTPQRVADTNEIVQALGRERAVRMLEAIHSTGIYVCIPLYVTCPLKMRARRIREMVLAGASVREVARACLVTERNVHRHKTMLRQQGFDVPDAPSRSYHRRPAALPHPRSPIEGQGA